MPDPEAIHRRLVEHADHTNRGRARCQTIADDRAKPLCTIRARDLEMVAAAVSAR
jgi:hypothetical protein